MKVDSELIQTDWVHFLDRRRSMFIYFPYVYAEFNLLADAIGVPYRCHLFRWSGDRGAHYRSKSELESVNVHLLEILKNHVPRVQEWYDRALAWDAKARELIEFFESNKKEGIALPDFESHFLSFATILMHTVTIPYIALSAIDSAMNEKGDVKPYERAQRILEPLRAFTTYPQLERLMLAHFWKLASTRSGIQDFDLLDKATPDELISLGKGGAFPTEEKLKQRKEWCMFWHPESELKWEFIYDRGIVKELSVLKDEPSPDQAVLRGQVAMKGKATGRVARIDNRGDLKNYSKGDIVVSINTSPDLMPALATCSAIVSEEGGIMCHAAIVSRELRVPCVIGVKGATAILKNGDLVEVDAGKGTVSLLSRP
jgi:phosphohistidine swiveling domain-containing protein